jgi:hypothetical protein
MHGLGVVIILIWLLRGSSGAPKLVAGILKFSVLVIATPFAVEAGYAGAVPWLMALVLFWGTTPLLDWVVVPLRMPRVAYWVVKIGQPLSFVGASAAGGVIYGTLAAARGRSPLRSVEWLREKLNAASSQRGENVVAAGLLAGLRGQRHRARCLLLVADALPADLTSRKGRRIARDWLVADAARVGNWRDVIRLGRRKRASLRWSYAMALIGQRLLGDKDAPAGWLLRVCWLLAPRRAATLPLLRRALATRASGEQPASQRAATELPHALGDLAQALGHRQSIDGAALLQSVGAVNAVLDDPAIRAHILERLAALGARGNVETVIAGARQRLVNVLIPVLEDVPDLAPANGGEPIVEAAVARVRTQLFADIETQCKDYRGRTKSKSALDRLTEWELWAVTRNSADRLLRLDPASERAVFETMWPVCNNFAVLQHNECHRLTFAYEIYSWLHRHAQSAPSALQLLAGNMRSARREETPTSRLRSLWRRFIK